MLYHQGWILRGGSEYGGVSLIQPPRSYRGFVITPKSQDLGHVRTHGSD